MPLEYLRYQVGFAVWMETREADEQHSRVKEPLAEDHLSEILVRSQQNPVGLAAAEENNFIVDTGVQLGDKQHFVSISAEPFDDLPVDALIRENLHPATLSIGYTTSARRTSAANAIAARTLSVVSRGCSDKI